MRYIRNYLVLFLTFVTGTAMFASCSDEEEGGFSGETKISATELAFAESGGTQTLSIASETEPQVVSNQDWCSVAFANATQRGTYTYDVIAEANTETEARTATRKLLGFGTGDPRGGRRSGRAKRKYRIGREPI